MERLNMNLPLTESVPTAEEIREQIKYHVPDPAGYAGRQHMTFEEWLEAVDTCFVRICGVGTEELPDWDYSSCYEADKTPRQAEGDALRCMGF